MASNKGALFALAAVALAAAYAMRGKGAGKAVPGGEAGGKPKPKPKPDAAPNGPTVQAQTPGGNVVVTLPAPEQIEAIMAEALEAAEKAEAQIGTPEAAATAAQAPAPAAKPKPKPKPDAGAELAARPPKAALLAPGVAQNIRTKKYDYSRQSLRDFQKADGLVEDGIYGPVTAAALGKYTNAPAPLFKGAKKKAGG